MGLIMNIFQKKKKENIIAMFRLLGEKYNKMKDTQLKKDYRRLIYFIQSDKGDLKKILESIDKKIKLYSLAPSKIVGLENEGVVKFWKQIKTIIMNVYIENKKLDMGL